MKYRVVPAGDESPTPLPRSKRASVRIDLHSDLVGNVSGSVISFPALKRQQQRCNMLKKVHCVNDTVFVCRQCLAVAGLRFPNPRRNWERIRVRDKAHAANSELSTD